MSVTFNAQPLRTAADFFINKNGHPRTREALKAEWRPPAVPNGLKMLCLADKRLRHTPPPPSPSLESSHQQPL